MIREENVFLIGRITRYRGIIGEVELQITDDAFDRGKVDYLILKIDGIFVPFFWEEYRFKNDNTIILKLEDIDSEFTAQRLVGTEAFYPVDAINKEDGNTFWSLQALIGFYIIDQHNTNWGQITSVDESSANVLFTLSSGHLIPYHDDLLIDYNLKKKEIHLNIPAGILDLN